MIILLLAPLREEWCGVVRAVKTTAGKLREDLVAFSMSEEGNKIHERIHRNNDIHNACLFGGLGAGVSNGSLAALIGTTGSFSTSAAVNIGTTGHLIAGGALVGIGVTIGAVGNFGRIGQRDREATWRAKEVVDTYRHDGKHTTRGELQHCFSEHALTRGKPERNQCSDKRCALYDEHGEHTRPPEKQTDYSGSKKKHIQQYHYGARNRVKAAPCGDNKCKFNAVAAKANRWQD